MRIWSDDAGCRLYGLNRFAFRLIVAVGQLIEFGLNRNDFASLNLLENLVNGYWRVKTPDFYILTAIMLYTTRQLGKSAFVNENAGAQLFV